MYLTFCSWLDARNFHFNKRSTESLHLEQPRSRQLKTMIVPRSNYGNIPGINRGNGILSFFNIVKLAEKTVLPFKETKKTYG